MAKRINPNLFKIHLNYSIGEAAETIGVHKNTVREWIKQDLPTIDNRRPTLILGSDLRYFLQSRREKKKRKCSPGTIYCVRCKEPKTPMGNMVDYQQITKTKGNLVGICPDCEAVIHQFIGLARLGEIRQIFGISMPQVGKHISGRG